MSGLDLIKCLEGVNLLYVQEVLSILKSGLLYMEIDKASRAEIVYRSTVSSRRKTMSLSLLFYITWRDCRGEAWQRNEQLRQTARRLELGVGEKEVSVYVEWGIISVGSFWAFHILPKICTASA